MGLRQKHSQRRWELKVILVSPIWSITSHVLVGERDKIDKKVKRRTTKRTKKQNCLEQYI
jgi:hypothetical protein